MSKLLNKLLLFTFLFLYIYNIQFYFMPYSFPFMFGMLGLILYIFNIKKSRQYWQRYKTKFEGVFLVISSVIFVDICTMIGNNHYEFVMTKYMIVNIISIWGAYFISNYFRYVYGCINFRIVILYLVMASVLQLTLALSMWFGGILSSEITNWFAATESSLRANEASVGFRLLGFGISYFPSGVIHGLILILLSVFFYKKLPVYKLLVLLSVYLYIILVSIMMARTVLIGMCLSIICIVYFQFKSNNIKRFFISIVCLFLLFGIIVTTLLNSLPVDLEPVLNWAFELFINYSESGTLETTSTDHLFEMYVFPNDLKTWIIGDAKWIDNGHYYMYTDVGYCRYLFYFGILGSFVFFMFQFLFIHKIYKSSKNIYGMFFYVFIFYVCILNLKGNVDLFIYLLPFIFIESKDNNLIIKKHEA